MQPFFSISIPTLGKIDQWKFAIQSILDQTFKDFEIIAIDSGPETASRPIIESLNDPRIHYINTSDKDPRLNWDRGFREARGTYIIWFEDDNYMLPHELMQLAMVINETDADIVTGECVHWRGAGHYIKNFRNQLIVRKQLFSGEVKRIDQKNIIRTILDIPQHEKPTRSRMHMTHTAVRHTLVDRYISRVGKISFGSTGTHALRVGLLALARTIYLVERPLSIIGMTGSSLSDAWGKSYPHTKFPKFEYRISPVTGHTNVNYRNENYLLVKNYLKKEMAEFVLDEIRFFRSYRYELIFIIQPWKELFRVWYELLRVLQHSSDAHVRALYRNTLLYFCIAVATKCARIIRLYDFIKLILGELRKSKKAQIIIPLDGYGVKNIRECAQKLPFIIEKELGLTYEKFCGLPASIHANNSFPSQSPRATI